MAHSHLPPLIQSCAKARRQRHHVNLSAMRYNPANPLIVQSDKSILLEVDNPRYEEARDALARFAELEKSPEHIHTYRITPLSLWNAAAAGLRRRADHRGARRVRQVRAAGATCAPTSSITSSRYGRVKLVAGGRSAAARVRRPDAADRDRAPPAGEAVPPRPPRGRRPRSSIRRAAATSSRRWSTSATRPRTWRGTSRAARWRSTLRESRASTGIPFELRHYQQEAVDVFHAGGSSRGG